MEFFQRRLVAEYVGTIAIILSVLASVFQWQKTQASKDMSSFSLKYLMLVCASEALLTVQGAIQHSPTMIISRLFAFAYFAYMTTMALMHDRSDGHSTSATPNAAVTGADQSAPTEGPVAEEGESEAWNATSPAESEGVW